ncbi:inorganic pyrophosphatase domain-containing protein [Ditylenchus destructor]|nr:inorganic pyrophosphatase domain-containing protein [Ditylenchus destructor]
MDDEIKSGKSYEVMQCGTLNSADYRLYFTDSQGFISPWHDIPIFADEKNRIYNMVLEIPRWSTAIMEMNTNESLNPIMQTKDNGNTIEFMEDVFPYHGYIWNHGALPQTWEDPNCKNESINVSGNNAPLDVIEIGTNRHRRGDVIQVKILGALALMDEGQLVWKLISIDIGDPLSSEVNTITDVVDNFDGVLESTKHWLTYHKVPFGKSALEIAFDGQFQDQQRAYEIILQSHQHWKELVQDKTPQLNTECCRVANAVFSLTETQCDKIVKSHDDP